MYKNNRTPRWREGSILLKDFYKLSTSDKRIYVESILKVPVEELDDTDEYILHFFHKKEPDNFFSLKEN